METQSGIVFAQNRPIDCIGIGRLCIDLNANEIHRPMEETLSFTKYLGGSPANITVAMARLGLKTGFIGKVSDDQFGRYIRNYLSKTGIDASQVATDQTGAATGLAFTEIKSPTDCSILMYRDNVADLKLEPAEVNEAYINKSKALLISGTALAASPSREAVFYALDYARTHQVVTVFDIDYRPYTWKNQQETAIYLRMVAERCDVLIGGKDEMMRMNVYPSEGELNDRGLAEVWLEKGARLVVMKHGGDGSVVYTKDGRTFQGRIFPAQVVKTFGAGDAFAGGFIYGLMNGWPLPRCQDFGSAAASIVVASHSCSDAMPTVEQIEAHILSYDQAK